MQLLVIGLNHKTAPVALRERLAFGVEDLPLALLELQKISNGGVIVSTCNRTEIYVMGQRQDNLSDLVQCIIDWLLVFKQIVDGQIHQHLYIYKNTHALTHWIRVAVGLDSMILGEPQIFGQIKQAVHQANQAGYINNQFSWLIQQVFATAKQIRNESRIGSQAVSLGFAAAKLVTQVFHKPSNNTLLVVAAGEMNRLVATNIIGLGIQRVIICNRSRQRAENLAQELANPNRQIDIIPLEKLSEILYQADIVTSCSGSLYPLINKKMAKSAMKQRRYQPMLMIDLAVPRDIEASIGQIDDIYLYSIDDLQHVIAGNIEQRQQAAVEAELLVSQLVATIEQRFAVRQMGQNIQHYRKQTQKQADDLLNQALQKLKEGENTEKLLKQLARKLTQTLTHNPSKLMRDVASQQSKEVIDFVVERLTEELRE